MDNIITSKAREVKHCPPHFIKVPVENKSNTFARSLSSIALMSEEPEHKIRNWCHENIENRFYIGPSIDAVDSRQRVGRIDRTAAIVETFVAAFEDPADATYFTLLLPSFLD